MFKPTSPPPPPHPPTHGPSVSLYVPSMPYCLLAPIPPTYFRWPLDQQTFTTSHVLQLIHCDINNYRATFEKRALACSAEEALNYAYMSKDFFPFYFLVSKIGQQ